jgi:hypothetical protein
MPNPDRKAKANLAILQHQPPQTRFSTTEWLQPTLDKSLLPEMRSLSIHITLHDHTDDRRHLSVDHTLAFLVMHQTANSQL